MQSKLPAAISNAITTNLLDLTCTRNCMPASISALTSWAEFWKWTLSTWRQSNRQTHYSWRSLSGWVASLRVFLRKSPTKGFDFTNHLNRELGSLPTSIRPSLGIHRSCTHPQTVNKHPFNFNFNFILSHSLAVTFTHITHTHSVSHYHWWRQQWAAETSGEIKTFGWWLPQENPQTHYRASHKNRLHCVYTHRCCKYVIVSFVDFFCCTGIHPISDNYSWWHNKSSAHAQVHWALVWQKY